MINKIKNNKLIMNITMLGSATLLNAILTFLVGILTRNLLGPEQYGYWLIVSLIFTFAPILQLGTLNAMNREIPYFIARSNFTRIKEIRELTYSFIFRFPFILVIIMFVISIILLFSNLEYEYKIGLLMASVIAFLSFISGYVETYYKSEQNFKIASRLISIRIISQAVITLVLVYLLGYTGLYFGMFFSFIIEIMLGKKIIPKSIKRYSLNDYKDLIRIGFPILVVGLVWNIMIATDRIIISFFLTPEDLGNYGIGMLVFSAMMLFPQVLSQVFYPKIVQLVSLKEFSKIKKYYWKVNILLAVIMLLIVSIVYFLMPFFIKWFMPEYVEGIKATQILLIGIYPLTLVNLAANYFNSTNNQKPYLIIQVVTIVLNILLSVLFLEINKSISSVAVATALTFTLYSILMNIVFLLKIRKQEAID